MPTNNHNLNTPPEGTTDWHVPLNENFESIDSILQNVSLDGESYSPNSVSTDQLTVGTDGPATSFADICAQAVYEYTMYLDGNTIIVEDATGAQQGMWDNAANEAHLAAQWMIDNQSAESPAWIAPGDYNYSGRINMAANTALHGTRAAKFVCQSQQDPFIKIEGVSNVELRGFQIDGQMIEGDFVRLNKEVHDIRVRNMKIGKGTRNIGSDMITTDISGANPGSEIFITGNECYDTGSATNTNQAYGIMLRSGDRGGVENVQITHNYCHDMDHNGIGVYGDAETVVVSNNIIENCGHTGISSSPSAGTIITNNSIRNMADNEQEGCAGIEIENDGAHTKGLAGRRCVVRNNTIQDCPFGFAMFKRNSAGSGDPDPHEVILDGNVFRNIDSNDQSRNPAAIELEAGKVRVRIGDNHFENCTERISFRQGTDANGQISNEMGSTIMGRAPQPSLVDVGSAPTYTGDGMQGRTIGLGFTPSYVAVQNSGGTWYDVHETFGSGYQHTASTGELSIVSDGFRIGDGGSDADPNTSGEGYTVYYER